MFNLLYDKWFLDFPLPNCITAEVLEYICYKSKPNQTLNELSFELESKFGNKHNLYINNIGIKQSINKIQYNQNNINWFYPIEPWGHLMYSLNIEGTLDYANFFERIPTNIINDVNNNKGKIIINYAHEGWVGEWLFKNFYLAIKNAGIKIQNVILILNDYNIEEKLKNFKIKYNIKDFAKIINYSYYLAVSSKNFYFKHKNNNIKLSHLNYNKPYKFLCLNRRLDLHRVKLLSEILLDIKNKSIVSFDKNLITSEVPKLFENNIELEKKFKLLPDKVIADREDIENTNGYQHENENLYLETQISIVTETSFYNDNDFISEKIWKPLYYFHPFIVVGRPHLLKYLKDIGFKTFDFLIDETYDTIEDNDLRMELIIKEIKKLNDISLDKINSIIKLNIDILIHNHNLLNSIAKQTEITESYFIKKIKEDNYNCIDIYKELKLELPNKII